LDWGARAPGHRGVRRRLAKFGAMEIPAAAVPYILLQRTQHLGFLRSPWAMRLFWLADRLAGGSGRDVFGSPIFHRAVRLEAAFRGGRVRRLYAAEIGAEFEALRLHLPARCASILDVGCGVAGIDALLYRHFAASSPRIHLLDKTVTSDRIYYGFKGTAAFYNSLDVARALLRANGVPGDRITIHEAAPDFSVAPDQELDLVISLISWGFHYPVATYLDPVHALLAADGRLILDVRGGTDGEEEVRQRFGAVRVIEERPRHRRLLAMKAG